MRPPWLQIDTELIEQVAPEVAIELDVDEMAVLGGLVRLIKWALGRVPEGALPSLHAIISGPTAAKQIARVAGHRGDPEAFVDACSRCAHPIFERLPDGVRIRGLDRYDAVVSGAEVRSAAAKVAAQARWDAERERKESGRGAKRMRDASGSHPKRNAKTMRPDAKTKMKTQTEIENQKETETKDSEPPPARENAPLAEVVVEQQSARSVDGLSYLRPVDVVHWEPVPLGCWEMIQLHRELVGLPREASIPAGFGAWAEDALAEVGPEGIERTFLGYLADDGIRAGGHPTAVFIAGVWDVRKPAPSSMEAP